jgi:hypothetical protein
VARRERRAPGGSGAGMRILCLIVSPRIRRWSQTWSWRNSCKVRTDAQKAAKSNKGGGPQGRARFLLSKSVHVFFGSHVDVPVD